MSSEAGRQSALRPPGARPRRSVTTRGSNQSDMRAYNERLILTVVRREGALPKAELARRTGLSAQATSVIMRSLESDGLLQRQTPVRGRVGQPSVPMAIAPQGAFFYGLHIGRRRAEMVLLDFGGQMRKLWHCEYRYPASDALLAFVSSCLAEESKLLDSTARQRVAGFGVAMPFGLWFWADQAGAPQNVLNEWKQRNFRVKLSTLMACPVFLQNDASAACSAELVFGDSDANLQDLVYFYVDTFVGGGIALNRSVVSGRSGNAGALGSILVPDASGRICQLIDVASLTLLEQQLDQSGSDSSVIWRSPDDWGHLETTCEAWIDRSAHGLAHAIVSSAAVLDFDGAIIDGALPATIRRSLVERVQQVIGGIRSEGLDLPRIREGTVGAHAGVLGGASLPLSQRFLVDMAALTTT